MTPRPDRALRRQLLLEHHGRQHEPAERRARRLDHAAMGERHEEETGIAEQGERQPAGERQQRALAPADAAEIDEAVAGESGRNTSPAQTKR